MRALVLFYAYDGDVEQIEPIAIISELTFGNLDRDDVEETWRQARDVYGADPSDCRAGWVSMPEVSALFGTPELGVATLAGGTA